MDRHALAVLLAAYFTYSFQSEDTCLMDISTNATGVGVVALSGNAVINGDAEVGPGGNPGTDITTNGNAAVNGNKGTAETTKDMTAMTDPGGGTPETLSVSGNNTKTISSGTYRLPNISISGNANLKILSRGSLTIYASGTVNISVNELIKILLLGLKNVFCWKLQAVQV